ncbi:squamosa promoter-binding-like protein 1 [Andrographis paniculata]|uniref:squamosa promoter-binding-like protein 1 n=1 Tax=Andrographis paniculata TaxID=175694 RepID=UPI0021E8DA60|nr:squamosa promoter-binding-like protein 1 [Andrographis paniculata]XP_051129341.1 squamosa promoter-binding-like protein 1 [Andrographis paniculata]
METKFGEKLPDLCGSAVPDMNAVGKRSMEWDLNDWRWDGDLFVAASQNPASSDCRSRQFLPVGTDIPVKRGESKNFFSGSNGVNLGDDRGKKDLEERRRYIGFDEQLNGEADSLNLKLGGQTFPVVEKDKEKVREREREREVGDKLEDKTGKKIKVSGSSSSRAVCQVEDCKADLSDAKDYHRRHKVCEAHSKATRALVGNIMQRFCQQCSRFHLLQEFDEGKRSCRRRLAGHNKRRRKTHPETGLNAIGSNAEQDSNYLLIRLLRILTNMHSSGSDQTRDQDVLLHLLRDLASLAGSTNEINPVGTLPLSQDLQEMKTTMGTSLRDSDRPSGAAVAIDSSSLTQRDTRTDNQDRIAKYASASKQTDFLFPEKASSSVKAKAKLKNIDLNNAYDGSEDFMEDQPDNAVPENLGNGSTVVPLWQCKNSQQSSPPQNSGNSASTPSHSPSTSSGETQSRTDRIVFKLFGKDPSEFPLVIRKQIIDWLSSSPMDIESYIRPGCVVLTIYASMDVTTWEELYYNLNFCLRRLLDSSQDSFWRTGWIYARVQDHATFAYNGQVVVGTPLPLKIHGSCRISSITPLAVSISEAARFVVKGFNLSLSTSRVFCALEGQYLLHESCADVTRAELSVEHEEIESLSFSCAIPQVLGRGFIEVVEDHGLSSSFFPFIVAEKDVCSDICNLESIIEVSEVSCENGNKLEARKRALDFMHEMGWLLHKSSLLSRLEEIKGDVNLFPFKRFRWLMEFSIDQDWCAVVKKLLDILSDGIVDAGQYASISVALQDIGPLHLAVRKNSRPMVEFLLAYQPKGALDETGAKQKQVLFRPDTVGPGGLTPLHVAASLDGCESMVDALTEDPGPGSVGIEAWKSAQDRMGLTPHDYACLRGHYTYVQLVQRKVNQRLQQKQQPGNGQQVVVVDIPVSHEKIGSGSGSVFQVAKRLHMQCRQCEEKLAYGRVPRRARGVSIYRPAMLSMVAIAAVCVCAALLFKSSPEVLYSCRPFRWELLKYGSE